MMGAREEAAAKAYHHALPYLTQVEATREALAAADAVMFSDEAVARAGEAVDAFTHDFFGACVGFKDRNTLIRAVIAALKGEA